MSIVALQDLGGAGPRESAPVIYHWSIVGSLARLAPLLVLGLLMLRKANRTRRAAAMLLFTILFAAPLGAVDFVNDAAIEEAFWLTGGLAVFMVSQGILWSLLDVLARGGRLGAFFGGALILGAAAVGSALFFAGFDLGYAVSFAVIACLCSAGYLVALLAAGVACRKGFRMPRFMGWFSVTLAVLPFLICLPFLLIAMLSIGAMIGWGEMVSAAMYCAVVCLGVSVAMLVMTLPFLWFGFRSPLYRACLAHIYGIPGLEPKVATASAEGVLA